MTLFTPPYSTMRNNHFFRLSAAEQEHLQTLPGAVVIEDVLADNTPFWTVHYDDSDADVFVVRMRKQALSGGPAGQNYVLHTVDAWHGNLSERDNHEYVRRGSPADEFLDSLLTAYRLMESV